MKYLLLSLFALIGCFTSRAQVGYGPELGFGFSTFKFNPPTYPVSYTSASVNGAVSGKIGGLVDVPLNKHTYFQAGIFLSRQGGERSFSYYANSSNNESVLQTLNIYYMELPLSVAYKTGMQGKGRFVLSLGAAPSYMVGGNYKMRQHLVINDTITDNNSSGKIVAGKTLKAFDIGIIVSAGYELPTGLFFRAWYKGGSADIGIGTEIVKNRVFGVSAGYFLGKGRNINKEAEDLIDKGE